MIRCAHCRAIGSHDANDVRSGWVICPACDRHFAWEGARARTPFAAGVAAVLAVCAVATAAPLAGQEPEPARALVVTAENLQAGDARHQEFEARGGDAAALLPGDTVRYRLLFTNVTAAEVRGVVFTNPVPSGLRYVLASATADRDDVTVEYSIDGGATFVTHPTVVVEVDGERVERPAPPEAYTHVRWTVKGWVAPGAQVTAEFRAELAPPAGLENDSARDRRASSPNDDE